LVIQEAWAWLTSTQLVRASQAAALRSGRAAARALRRSNQALASADEGSFTAGRHHAIQSMTSTQVTAASSLEALAAAADSAARACLHTLSLPRTAAALLAGAEGTAQVPACQRDQDHRHQEAPGHRVRARLLLTTAQGRRQEGGTRPGQSGARGPWNRAPSPPRHAG
jgi:hypothetical protein